MLSTEQRRQRFGKFHFRSCCWGVEALIAGFFVLSSVVFLQNINFLWVANDQKIDKNKRSCLASCEHTNDVTGVLWLSRKANSFIQTYVCVLTPDIKFRSFCAAWYASVSVGLNMFFCLSFPASLPYVVCKIEKQIFKDENDTIEFVNARSIQRDERRCKTLKILQFCLLLTM